MSDETPSAPEPKKRRVRRGDPQLDMLVANVQTSSAAYTAASLAVPPALLTYRMAQDAYDGAISAFMTAEIGGDAQTIINAANAVSAAALVKRQTRMAYDAAIAARDAAVSRLILDMIALSAYEAQLLGSRSPGAMA